jgi:hypothetical protein
MIVSRVTERWRTNRELVVCNDPSLNAVLVEKVEVKKVCRQQNDGDDYC